LLSARGKVLWANTAAETLLRARAGLISSRDGVLTGALAADTKRLSALVAAVSSGTGSTATLRRASDMPPLLALGVPCALQPDPWRDVIVADTAPRVALFVLDPSASLAGHGSTAPAIRLRALFGLTAAEAAAALAVASGDGLPGVAHMFGVAPGTVRTHVKSVFAKTQVHSQVELARLLAQLGLIEAEETT
jgi:DNA-binding CsgD family transcriptional regulator